MMDGKEKGSRNLPVDERMSTLLNNVNAVQAVSRAVEGTIGPKGLDTMLVDEDGNVIITNDGITILDEMEVSHPAASMIINIARSQQQEVGDGTTTATILAAALVVEGAHQVQRGVPVTRVIEGIRGGVAEAINELKQMAYPVEDLKDERLYHIAYIAGRENEDIARLVINGAQVVGLEKIKEPDFHLRDLISAREGAENELFQGVLINRIPISREMPYTLKDAKVLIIQDALAPEEIDDEALGTETGFQRFLALKEAYSQNLMKLKELGVGFIALAKSCDGLAEEYCVDHGIMVLQHVPLQDLQRLGEHTGSRLLKRFSLSKEVEDLKHSLGYAGLIETDEQTRQVKILQGKGKPVATMLVGAATKEVAGERERIAKDAASAVQATLKGGYHSGGGATELYLSRHLEEWKKQVKGMGVFGVEAVSTALQKPFFQMVSNAGFNPIEKIELVKEKQSNVGSSIGLDFDTGECKDMLEIGVVDPALVKIHGIKIAGEVSEAILRIHTVLRRKNIHQEDF